MLDRLATGASVIALAAVLSGCLGAGTTSPEETATPAASNSSIPTPIQSMKANESPTTTAGPSINYTPPQPHPAAEPYAVAPNVEPAAVKACAALDIGSEVFATMGKATLSKDSTTKGASGGLLCSFVSASHAPDNPNFLAVTVREKSVEYYKTLAVDSAVGWVRQDVIGVGDQARFYESGPTGEQASHMLHALKGQRMVSFLARFTAVPEGSDLSVSRYGSIANKVFS